MFWIYVELSIYDILIHHNSIAKAMKNYRSQATGTAKQKQQ
jgi:hypothetical protein